MNLSLTKWEKILNPMPTTKPVALHRGIDFKFMGYTGRCDVVLSNAITSYRNKFDLNLTKAFFFLHSFFLSFVHAFVRSISVSVVVVCVKKGCKMKRKNVSTTYIAAIFVDEYLQQHLVLLLKEGKKCWI